MDTAKDARVLVLEDALRRLNEIVGNRKLKMHIEYGKLNEILKKAGSFLYEVKYAYQDSKSLASLEATEKLVSSIADFAQLYRTALTSGYKPSTVKEQVAQAEVVYSLRVVESFQKKLRNFDEEPAFAVDILAVEVSQLAPVKDSTNLTECRCTDGIRIWKIITNISGIKEGTKLACAVLPPVEMMNVLSEAMFLGGTPLPDDTPLGPLTNPPSSALDQARAQVLHITKRMT
ncbi:MAG: hypothetical protein ACFFED_04570 [Candidatus Thorarchaeota archaeon]